MENEGCGVHFQEMIPVFECSRSWETSDNANGLTKTCGVTPVMERYAAIRF